MNESNATQTDSSVSQTNVRDFMASRIRCPSC